METRKRWQFILILAVIALTIYNILPTVFYYTKPLKEAINKPQATEIAVNIADRVNALEPESVEWLHSFCDLLHVKPASITLDKENPAQVTVLFQKSEDADIFRAYLPRAGSLIPFQPASLSLSPQELEENPKKVLVERKIPISLPKSAEPIFTFAEKNDALYKEIIWDRASELAAASGSNSESSLLLAAIIENGNSFASSELTYNLAMNIVSYLNVFGDSSPITKRFFTTFTQSPIQDPASAIQVLTSSMQKLKDEWKLKRIELAKQVEEKDSSQLFDEKAKIRILERKEEVLTKALGALKKYNVSFLKKEDSEWNYEKAFADLQKSASTNEQELLIGKNSPFIKELIVDWHNEKILFTLHDDLLSFKKALDASTDKSFEKDELQQLLINEIARISRLSGEKLSLQGNEISIPMHVLPNAQSMLVLNLSEVAKTAAKKTEEIIKNSWMPKNSELSSENFPVVDYETYQNLPQEQKSLCLLVYSPLASSEKTPPFGYRNNSLYIVAKGMDTILKRYQAHPDSEEAKSFIQDFYRLQEILQQNGFVGYSGASLPKVMGLSSDFVFEHNNYYQTLLAATRENFHVEGSKRFAVLEFSDVEQRILTLNQIETKIHEDLLKSRDEYNSARVSINPEQKYDAPKPIRNVFWNNFILSFKKYFRGDERKILHWGLDLSGGKTVAIELRDQNNRPVKNEADIRQGINELYNRVNKMGVSEVNIRQEGSNIVLDFPGSQNLSAAELVKASSMYFHIVNEKFSPTNSSLSEYVNRFLQEVWNEAVVTNRKDAESINQIAWKHLYGDSLDPEAVQPRTDAAKALYENGLQFANPQLNERSSVFNDSLSKIALVRGDEWFGQTNPLMIVFNNFALEGSSLDNIRASYDPSKGNFLSFEVKGSNTSKEGRRSNPREELYAWTSQFSKEKISGTPNEAFTKGRGWRMAVILNDSVISAPALESALKDSAMITGSFSQREVNQLVADLKAGSLTYTPRILSEKNVSPELGVKDRMRGIGATALALVLVIAAMALYYRFAGLVASIAVLFNLLIMWATLQNLNATLSLAGIAGIILTVGMAVDANVLVFERIKEEFAITKRIAAAVHAGYKKAFSAILDSNVTTIIAALILLHFDSGPIKGFALTLIIGIVSSMFTALFMTKFFFAGWVQNPEHKHLTMANFVKSTSFDFLKRAKLAFAITLLVILAGIAAFVPQKSSLFGMDFTGGYSLTVEVEPKANVNYRAVAEKALEGSGASHQDFQVRELSPANNLRILLGTSMEKNGKPFYQMPLEKAVAVPTYPYETNPRITWVVDALQKEGFVIEQRILTHLDSHWTSVSGQLSDSMKKNAIIGLLLALVGIFIYITVRFEFKFAMSAMLCTLHDVVITISMISILHYLGMPLQIDLNTIAAIMTIIGYSLNDTIIIFDRIREDMRQMHKSPLPEIVNHALNITLSRTTITSGTTLLVLLALVALGGASIFSFSFVMAMGVVFGTLSSLFVASPLMLFFAKREEKKELPLNGIAQG